MGRSKKATNVSRKFLLIKVKTLKKYDKIWSKIRDLIRSITNNTDDYDEKYMKIKSNSDDNLLLQKTMELRNMVIVVRCF